LEISYQKNSYPKQKTTPIRGPIGLTASDQRKSTKGMDNQLLLLGHDELVLWDKSSGRPKLNLEFIGEIGLTNHEDWQDRVPLRICLEVV
jgi:hypothetical protein